jgi:hypothetical protein
MTETTPPVRKPWFFIVLALLLGLLTVPAVQFFSELIVTKMPLGSLCREFMNPYYWTHNVGGPPAMHYDLFLVGAVCWVPFLFLSGAAYVRRGLPRRRFFLMFSGGLLGASLSAAMAAIPFLFPRPQDNLLALGFVLYPPFLVLATGIGLVLGSLASHLPLLKECADSAPTVRSRKDLFVLPVVYAISVAAAVFLHSLTIPQAEKDARRTGFARGEELLKEAWKGTTEEARKEWTAGYKASQDGDQKTAAQHFSAACKGGHANACEWVVSIAARMQKDEARPLYEVACSRDVAYACNGLGVIEEEAGNRSRAKVLFQKACEKKLMEACSNLGLDYYLENNLPEAERLSKLACENNNGFGCYTLGALYGSRKKAEKAIQYYQRACDLGHAKGCGQAQELRSKVR